jgi:hypothetical protein
LALVLSLLGGLPAGMAAQSSTNINQDNTAYGTTAAEFLLLGAGARGTALGGAYAAIANDVSALYYNPAGTAFMTRPGITIGTYNYVADTRYSWGGIAFPFSGGSRNIGFQLGTFGFKNQPVYTTTDPNNASHATYSVSETFAGMTFSQNFSDRFAAGITGKFVSDQLGEAKGTAFAVDFGTNFHSNLGGRPIKFSFTVTNLGTGLSYHGDALNVTVPRDTLPAGAVPGLPQPATLRTKSFQLPTTFRVGLAYDIVHKENDHLTLLGDFNQPNNNKAGFVFGTEFGFDHLGNGPFGVALRGSYSYQPANNIAISSASTTQLSGQENKQGLAGGGGINYKTGTFRLGVDYAYRYMGILGGTHFLSFDLGW